MLWRNCEPRHFNWFSWLESGANVRVYLNTTSTAVRPPVTSSAELSSTWRLSSAVYVLRGSWLPVLSNTGRVQSTIPTGQYLFSHFYFRNRNWKCQQALVYGSPFLVHGLRQVPQWHPLSAAKHFLFQIEHLVIDPSAATPKICTCNTKVSCVEGRLFIVDLHFWNIAERAVWSAIAYDEVW